MGGGWGGKGEVGQGRRKEKERREEGGEEKGERGGVRGKIMGFPPSSQDCSPFGLRERAPSLSVLITSLSATSIASTTVASLPGARPNRWKTQINGGFLHSSIRTLSRRSAQQPQGLSRRQPGLSPSTGLASTLSLCLGPGTLQEGRWETPPVWPYFEIRFPSQTFLLLCTV